MAGWENFFIAEVGASAALAGLIFVAISINLTKILAYPGLPGRALEALVTLLAVLVTSSLLLVPGQSLAAIGTEILIVGLIVWAGVAAIQVNCWRKFEARYRRPFILQIMMNQIALLPFILSGIFALAQGTNGLYWLVPGFIFCFLAAILDAWVLLVEINR
jgi:modulator of FtsH protease